MSAAGPVDLWGEFSEDPRRPEVSAMRAGDADRDVVLGVLADGYAEGRLTREEYDERAARTGSAKTLGDLPPLIVDLIRHGVPGAGLSRTTGDQLHGRAVRSWESQRAQALTGLLIPSIICWVVWVSVGMGFPWPVFVTLGTGMHLIRVLLNRQGMIADEEERLRREPTMLEPPRRD